MTDDVDRTFLFLFVVEQDARRVCTRYRLSSAVLLLLSPSSPASLFLCQTSSVYLSLFVSVCVFLLSGYFILLSGRAVLRMEWRSSRSKGACLIRSIHTLPCHRPSRLLPLALHLDHLSLAPASIAFFICELGSVQVYRVDAAVHVGV